MRAIAFAAVLALAACSEGEPPQNNSAAAAAEDLETGQWETVLDVSRVEEVDGAPPMLKLASGDKVARSSCVVAEEASRPAPALLAGMEGARCQYQNIYMSRGRLNASMTCRVGDLPGDVLVAVEGNYTGGTFEANSTIRTQFTTAGDSVVTAKLTGRRTGDCAADPAGNSAG